MKFHLKNMQDIVCRSEKLPSSNYKECIDHPNCHRVVALSGGYPADEANERLSKQNGMIASFSRAFAAGLSQGQSAEEFDATLDATIEGTFKASCT